MKSLLTTTLLAVLACIPTFGVETSVKPYPLDKCIVSDEKLGVEGKPVVFIHEGQEIKLCCQDCRKDFDANPAKYLAKLPKVEAPKAEPKKAGMDHKMLCACCAGDAKAADGKAAGHDQRPRLDGRTGFVRLPRPNDQGLLQALHREVREESSQVPEKARRQISLPKPRRSGAFYWARPRPVLASDAYQGMLT